MRFLIAVDVEPDDANEGHVESIRKLKAALEHSTASEALSSALQATVSMHYLAQELNSPPFHVLDPDG